MQFPSTFKSLNYFFYFFFEKIKNMNIFALWWKIISEISLQNFVIEVFFDVQRMKNPIQRY